MTTVMTTARRGCTWGASSSSSYNMHCTWWLQCTCASPSHATTACGGRNWSSGTSNVGRRCGEKEEEEEEEEEEEAEIHINFCVYCPMYIMLSSVIQYLYNTRHCVI